MFLELKYKWTLKEGQDQDSFFLSNVMRNPSTANDDGSTYLQSARTPWRPLDEKLVPQEEGFTDEELLSKLKGGYGAAAAKLYLNSAVWLRVQSDGDDSKVVDMVPACFEDDAQSGSSGGVGSMLMAEMGKEICGESFPLMKFDTQGSEGQNVEFNFSVEDLDKMCETPRSVSLYPKSAIVSDPRWNFAPEYWYNAGATLSEDVWLDNCQRQQGDGDIFMATSDQGYLQSKYELAFLPRITRMVPSNGAQIIGNMASLKTTPRVSLPGSFNDTVNKSYMWRMFDPIDEDYEAFRDLPFMSAGRGVKVNPYSDSTNVIMAAFANTPVDWRMSSTNNLEDLLSLNATDFNKKYAYCAYADESAYKVAWDELTLLAGEFMDRMRNSPKLDWTENWIDFDWFGDSTKLWGHEFQNARFWGVDKRFLYGFWSDCFAANQQLFLVFVRAEPIMMGGGSINHVPPQLGARAVALVWRDPSMPREPNAPHKTRVLFYRQFE
jgi:hypothetical protein